MPPIKRKKFNYHEDQMKRALEEVSRGLPIATAAKNYGVPRMTLSNKWKGKSPRERRMGPEAILRKEEEGILVKWILKMGTVGFPITKNELLDSVQQLIRQLERKNPFIDNRPTVGWLQRFKSRHPEISLRTAQNLTVSRASVTKEKVSKWFTEIHEYLVINKYEDILTDPSRVFNGDESAFFLNPKGNKVLTGKGQKNVYQQINADEKECLTVLVTANAAGQIAPTMVIFKYDRIPRELANSVPETWLIGKSETGWMNSATFYEYIANGFYPWLVDQKITFPVILFIDGHASHLTYHTSKFCDEHNIILVALYPNATHLMQPMDVAVFRTLKEGWKQKVHLWRTEHIDHPILKRKDFCPLLEDVLKEKISESVLKNGFRKCGLVPWNPDAIQFPIETTAIPADDLNVSFTETKQLSEMKNGLDFLHRYLDPIKLDEFKTNEGEWTGDIRDQSLFEFYRDLKKKFIELEKKAKTTQTEEEIAKADRETSRGNKKNVNMTATTSKQNEPVENIFNNYSPKPLSSKSPAKPVQARASPDIQRRILKDLLTPNNKISIIGLSSPKNNPKEQVEEVKRVLIIDDQVIPTPFKTVLRWPETQETGAKKRKKEKIPFVASSKQWQEYHARKEKQKIENENNKKVRADDRLRKKQEKEKLKQTKLEEKGKKLLITKKKKKLTQQWSDTSSESEEWVESGSSGDDVSLFEDELENNLNHDLENNQKKSYKKGDFVIVKFPGKKRFHQYICIIQDIFENEELEVVALNCCNETKTIFKLNDKDVSIIQQEQIIENLCTPSLDTAGDRVRYKFERPVMVDG